MLLDLLCVLALGCLASWKAGNWLVGVENRIKEWVRREAREAVQDHEARKHHDDQAG